MNERGKIIDAKDRFAARENKGRRLGIAVATVTYIKDVPIKSLEDSSVDTDQERSYLIEEAANAIVDLEEINSSLQNKVIELSDNEKEELERWRDECLAKLNPKEQEQAKERAEVLLSQIREVTNSRDSAYGVIVTTIASLDLQIKKLEGQEEAAAQIEELERSRTEILEPLGPKDREIVQRLARNYNGARDLIEKSNRLITELAQVLDEIAELVPHKPFAHKQQQEKYDSLIKRAQELRETMTEKEISRAETTGLEPAIDNSDPPDIQKNGSRNS